MEKKIIELKKFEQKLWLATPTIHGEEQKYVQEAFETNWVSTVGINLNELEMKLTQLSNLYKTNNNDKLNNINFEIKNKFNKINSLHSSYIEIINRTITKYKDTSKIAENILSNINTNIN